MISLNFRERFFEEQVMRISLVTLTGLVLLVSFVSVPMETGAVTDRGSLESLAGISELSVSIEVLPPAAKGRQLTRGVMEQAVLEMLKEAGIKALGHDEAMKKEMNEARPIPFLMVSIGAFAMKDQGWMAVSVDLRFHQSVKLWRNPKIHSVGATWLKSFTGLVPQKRFAELVAPTLGELVREFIKDFKTVNPSP